MLSIYSFLVVYDLIILISSIGEMKYTCEVHHFYVRRKQYFFVQNKRY